MSNVLPPPPSRGAAFFAPRPELQGPQLPGSLQPQQPDQPPFAAPPPPDRVSQSWAGWFRNVYNVLRPGVTKQVVISGTTLTFVNGIFTGSSP